MRALWLLLVTLVLGIVLVAWLWLPSLRETYLELVRREADAAWLRTQCQNEPQFRTHMARLCAEASTVQSPSPTWRRTLLGVVTTWPASTVGATIAFVLAVVMVPGLCLTYRERIEHRRMLQACSPQLTTVFHHQQQQLRVRTSSSRHARCPGPDSEII